MPLTARPKVAPRIIAPAISAASSQDSIVSTRPRRQVAPLPGSLAQTDYPNPYVGALPRLTPRESSSSLGQVTVPSSASSSRVLSRSDSRTSSKVCLFWAHTELRELNAFS